MLFHIDPLRLWVHKVLPVVYDDSLSYYEVLAKVTKKLNEVIDLTEEQNQYIEEFSTNLTNAINHWEDGMEQEWSSYKSGLNNEWGAFQRNTEQYIENWKNMAESDIEDAIAAGINQFVSYFSDLTQTAVDAAERAMEAAENAAQDAVDAVMPTLESQFDERYAWKTAVGSPLVATTAAGMTDTTKVYVYAGSETGYVNGDWYYYDGTAWQDGGVYNSAAVVTDPTLSESGVPADAKAAGDEIADLKSTLYADSTDYTSQIEQGYVYNASVSHSLYSFTKAEQENRACYSFTATAGDEIVYSGRTTSSNQRPLYAVRENGSLVTSLVSNVGYNHQVVSITEDCTVYVNFKTNASEIPYILKRKPIFNTLTTYQEAKVQRIIDIQPQDADVTDLMRGYQVGSDFGAWSLGYYNTSLEAKSSTKYAKLSKFNSTDELVLITKKGYFIQGGYKLNGVTKYDTRESSMRIPSNVTTVSICVSKMPYGDDTRPDITVEEAESSLLIVNLTPTSNYYRYKGTFFGFEMYNRVAFVGDSYTQKRATYNKAWGQIIGQKTGIDVALFGHSGYTTNNFINASGTSDSLSGMLAATACNLYWLGFGINDSAVYKANPEYLGSVEDLSGPYTDYPNTFWGNYGRIIESIQATFPSAKIVICGCIYNSVYNAQVGSDTTRIAPINAAIAEIAEHYSIPSISLYDDVFYLSPEYDKNMQATAYTHPDPIIFPGMANANMRLFSKCVADNPEYFRTSTAE